MLALRRPLFASVTLAMAGCIGVGEVADPLPALPMAEVSTSTWTGYLRAGAVQDVPGHLAVTGDAGRQVWNMSFYLDIDEVPDLLEVEVAWQATAARFMLMVIGPEEEPGTPPIYENPNHALVEQIPGRDAPPEYTDASPLCSRIPTEQLTVGRWSVMAHSGVAVDADLTFTVRSAGGAVRIVDHAHEFSLPAFVEIVRDHERRLPLQCEGAA